MAFKGAMSGFKPKYDDEDEEAASGKPDDEEAEGEEDDDESLGMAAIRASRAGMGTTFAEMVRRICDKK